MVLPIGIAAVKRTVLQSHYYAFFKIIIEINKQSFKMEHYTSKNTNAKNTAISNLLILIIIILGFAGTVSTLKGGAATDSKGNLNKTYSEAGLPSRINDLNSDQSTPLSGNKTITKQGAHLRVSGRKVVGGTLKFEIKSFNSNGNYYIDYGNGKNQKVKRQSSSFSYMKAGTYVVMLKVEYNGKTQILHKEDLIIKDDFQLAKK